MKCELSYQQELFLVISPLSYVKTDEVEPPCEILFYKSELSLSRVIALFTILEVLIDILLILLLTSFSVIKDASLSYTPWSNLLIDIVLSAIFGP